MALEVTSTSPCDLLNASGYPKLFLASSGITESVAYANIASGGTLVKYVDSLAASTMTNPILATPAPTSKFRLVQFLSGAGVASTAPGAASSTTSPGGGSSTTNSQPYSTLGAVALKTPSGQYEGIIDNYIAPAVSNYLTPTFTSGGASLVPDTKFWTPADIVDGIPQPNATSILGKLIKAGYLLSESQVYTPTQLSSNAKQPNPGSESLIYLYNLAQTGKLSAAQQTLQTTLEATNLRFFGAFMAEYCYYRTRYDWLLKKFFEIYSTPTTGANAYSSSASSTAAGVLYGSGRPIPSTSTNTSLTQSDYIAGLAYQMACLNMRLADMRTLLSKINAYYNGVFTNIQADINSSTASGSNKKLTQTITALQTSASEANTYLTETDFAHEAMNYNSEKNRYSNILLGFYAFLNIAALATVFQLSRN